MAWLSVRSRGGTFVYRVEDLDGPRVVSGMEQRQMEDLAWLGIDWDEGPDVGGEHGPYRQSECSALYERALRQLDAVGAVFPCGLSRRDLREVASAPHHRDGSPYPASLRPSSLPDHWLEELLGDPAPAASVRFRVDPVDLEFEDGLLGRTVENVAREVGDFVLRRRDGLWAYQLAVVVDDARQLVNEVVRGADLLSSTARQILLQRRLGVPTPRYLHVPVLEDEEGEKLSKRHRALTLRALREEGWSAAEVVGVLAATLGLIERPEAVTVAELIPTWRTRGPGQVTGTLADSGPDGRPARPGAAP